MLKTVFATAALAFATAATAQQLYLPKQPAPVAEPVATEPSSPAAPAAEPVPAAAPMPAASTSLPRCSATVRDSCIQNERYASRKSTPGMRDNNALHNGARKRR